MLLWEIK